MTSAILYNNVASGFNRLYESMFIAINVFVKQLMKYDATIETRQSVNAISDNETGITYP